MGVTRQTANDPTAKFFEDLTGRGHEALLRKATGSARFDLVDGKRTTRWLLTVAKGDLAVSRTNADAAADCVMRADKKIFDQMATGKLNAVAAMLRGDLAIEGDWRLLVLVQRLFPGPPGSRKRKRAAGSARKHA